MKLTLLKYLFAHGAKLLFKVKFKLCLLIVLKTIIINYKHKFIE